MKRLKHFPTCAFVGCASLHPLRMADGVRVGLLKGNEMNGLSVYPSEMKAMHSPQTSVIDEAWVVLEAYTDRPDDYPIGRVRADGAFDVIAEVRSCFGGQPNWKVRANLVAAAPDMLRALTLIADRGPVAGYGSADALRLRLVATQSIAREALRKAGAL